jgi:hypothetical protein
MSYVKEKGRNWNDEEKIDFKEQDNCKRGKKKSVRSKNWGIAERGKNHFRLGRERHIYVMVFGLIYRP